MNSGLQSASPSLKSEMDESRKLAAEFESLAGVEIERLVALVRSDASLLERLGEPQIESLGRSAFVFRRKSRTVALRPGITGELQNSDPIGLCSLGARPAIFVNIVECVVSIDRHTTQNNILHELADQLKS